MHVSTNIRRNEIIMTSKCWNCGAETRRMTGKRFHPSVDYVLDRGVFWCRTCEVLWGRPW